MEQKKNELGRIYGARISKNGKWLNLIIRIGDGENLQFVTCTVKFGAPYEGDKTHATIYDRHLAMITQIPVYEERKEPEKPKEPKADDLPF